MTNDADNWYFTQAKRLWKFPNTHDLKIKVKSADPSEGILMTGIPRLLSERLYNHFGDCAYVAGFVLVPLDISLPFGLEKPFPPVMAAFRTSDLALHVHAELTELDGCGWVAVNARTSTLYTSRSTVSESSPVHRYRFDAAALVAGISLTLTRLDDLVLRDEQWRPLVLKAMQGGVLGDDGRLYLTNGFPGASSRSGGIHVFDPKSGRRLQKSSVSQMPFKYEFHPSFPKYEEPEGLTWYDLDKGTAPGIEGQLHVILLDNDLDSDDMYFKHYAVSESPDAIGGDFLRVVTEVRREDGDVRAVCNPNELWSPRSSTETISDIVNGVHSYVVGEGDKRVDIHVVRSERGPYLRTSPDKGAGNNLDSLPFCIGHGTGDVPIETIMRFAPVLRLHSAEEYFPMDPTDFIAQSRFRHHRGFSSDEGFNKVDQEWKKNNSHHRNYYDIPLDYVDAFGIHEGSRNRRPRDDNNGDNWNVFLQPKGRPSGVRRPSGVVPTMFYVKRDYCAISKGADFVIQYWWFFGYNDGFSFQNHQGDWEHTTVAVKNDRLIGAYYAGHGAADWYARLSLELDSERPHVYVAKGSHAAYAEMGSHHTLGVDNTDAGGEVWDTSAFLLPLSNRPWRNYAGAWGEVGQFSDTTGPLGPWHKRYRC